MTSPPRLGHPGLRLRLLSPREATGHCARGEVLSGRPGHQGTETVHIWASRLGGTLHSHSLPRNPGGQSPDHELREKGPRPTPLRAVSDPPICIHAATCWPGPLTIHSREARARAPTGP